MAARDPNRASQFAARHGIPVVHKDYSDIVSDPTIDAVYNPLPNSLHHEWTIRALQAGKHVLCEKPLASNTSEAAEMAAEADRCDRILMEAFHYRYHPLAERVRQILDGGALGRIRHIDVSFCTTLRRKNDIRLQYALAGGALMDVGCYAVHIARFLADAEPAVLRANARLWSPNVDRRIDADLLLPEGVTAHIEGSLFTPTLFKAQAIVQGEQGELRVLNPILPHYFHLILLRTVRQRRWWRMPGDSTYTYQLRAFADAVRTGVPPVTDAPDAVANMRVIDAIYTSAGLPLRGAPLPSRRVA